ncbi:DUF29 domain-containing protein [Nodosilinea sp. AN01ver1]|uniref:DUF29 domain-containing protein n=1 Tax=Nodosilinea sp. AN01ver1 TaxID=3423362 RepID=UPI003D32294E
MLKSLYDSDFYAWTQQQAKLLRSAQLDELDTLHVAEELEAMGRSEKRELASRLEVLLMHLLKWCYQPNLRSRSWQLTIKEQRLRLAAHLAENPSLKALLLDYLDSAYQLAVVSAERETGLDRFPDRCPYTLDQVFDPTFLPEA